MEAGKLPMLPPLESGRNCLAPLIVQGMTSRLSLKEETLTVSPRSLSCGDSSVGKGMGA